MNNENNISLSNLKEYEIAPPIFLFEKIKNKIEEQDTKLTSTLKSLFEHSVQPPTEAISFSGIMNRINNIDELNSFKPLKDYEITPPFSFYKIMEIIKNIIDPTKSTARVISITSNFKKIAAAAAVLLIGFVGYFTYKSNLENKQPSELNIANIITKPTPSVIAPNNINPIETTTSKVNDSRIGANVQKGNTTKNKLNINTAQNKTIAYGSASIKKLQNPNQFLINEANYTIIDNDYLATFASFNENNIPTFLRADNPVATKITIDKYADITISEGMGTMMKKMYKTRKSGKPTRRARKQKERLEKWKKADAEYFNPNANLNVIDPIDLGNFILYK